MPRLCEYAPADLNFAHFLQRLEEDVYEEVGPLRVTAWPTREPVSFSKRRQGRGVSLKPGMEWGKEVFDCAWFFFEGTVPTPCEKPQKPQKPVVLLIDVNGELCLYDGTGVPLAGLTSVASSYDFRLGKPGKRVYRPIRPFAPGEPIRLWADGGYNDLFGALSGNGSLVEARMAFLNEPAQKLYYDVAFLFDWLRSLPPEAPMARRLRVALDEAKAAWRPKDPASVEAALRVTGKIFAMKPGRGFLSVTAAGHAHLDLAWLWPAREGRRKAIRTLATALHMAERYPEYTFSASQAQMFAWIRDDAPDLFRRIAEAVRAGRIEPVGDAWVEPDTNMASGEALIRQIAFGRAFFQKEFGTRSEVMFLPDVFGYSAALPQILRGCGLRYFMTQKLSWNTINRFPHQTFTWEGLDGSRVLAHMPPEETYNSPASASAVRKLEENYCDIGHHDRALMLYGIGDGGGGPGTEHLENLRRLRNAYGLPNVTPGRVGDFFRSLEKGAGYLPVWRGELYLEKHQGTLTTQAGVKRSNRAMEVLLREVEWVLAADLALGGKGKDDERDALAAVWRDFLLFQFHDILPGSSIRRVEEETVAAYLSRTAELESLLETGIPRVARRVLRGGGAASSRIRIGIKVAFNSLPWPRKEWVRIEKAWQWIEAPALGVAAVRKPSAGGLPPSPKITGQRIDNGLVAFALGKGGGLASLSLPKEGIEFVADRGELGLFHVYADEGDAWDTPLDYRLRPPVRPERVAAVPFENGPEAGFRIQWKYDKSTIVQRVSLRAGSPLVFIENEIDWRNPLALLRAVFPCAIPQAQARAVYEIQFGWIERATHENTSWDTARHECAHQQWVDLGGSHMGLTVINEGKYGSLIKDSTIEMSLLRSVPYPSFDGWKDPKRSDGPPSSYSGLGLHRCRYALYPHAGDFVEAASWRRAREFNHPLRIGTSSAPASLSGKEPSLFAWEGDGHFDLSCFKPADSGKGVVLRIARYSEGGGRLRVRPLFPTGEAWETDMLENPLHSIASSSGMLSLDFRPFEVKTLLFEPPSTP